MKWAFVLVVASIGLSTASASAQEFGSGLIVQTAIQQNGDRGHNVSVQEQARPSYTSLGVVIGGLTLAPKIEGGTGSTSNVYLTSNNRISSTYFYESAAADLSTRWSRHVLRLSASTTHRQYVGEARRNENIWNIDARGQLEVRSSLKIDADVNLSKNFENLFSGEASSEVAALSQYRRNYSSLRATYTSGRYRTFAIVDRTDLDFSAVPLLSGGFLDQNYRDRKITRLTAQLEYGRSPSIALFAQISGSKVKYDQSISPNQPTTDSSSVRLLAGLNVDISRQWRGSIGIGYIVRQYDAAEYKTRRGIAAQVNADFFLTPRLTLGIVGQRTIEDITIGTPRPYLNTSGSIRADYELLRNMIISASGEYQYQGTGLRTFRAIAGTRYLASRRVHLRGQLIYTRRSDSLEEARLEVIATYRI
jgi:hypothetical protein